MQFGSWLSKYLELVNMFKIVNFRLRFVHVHVDLDIYIYLYIRSRLHGRSTGYMFNFRAELSQFSQNTGSSWTLWSPVAMQRYGHDGAHAQPVYDLAQCDVVWFGRLVGSVRLIWYIIRDSPAVICQRAIQASPRVPTDQGNFLKLFPVTEIRPKMGFLQF